MRHSNHWVGIDGDAERTLAEWLPLITRQGRAVINAASRRSQDAPPPEPGEVVFAIAWPETDLRAVALMVSDRHADGEAFWRLADSYPLIAAGVVHRLTVERVMELDGATEAVILASSAGGVRIAFFDTLYFMQRGGYRTGEAYDFVLGALAYALQVAEPEPLRVGGRTELAGPADAAFAALEEGPLTVDLAGSAMLFPIESGSPDDYLFQAPVHAVSETVVQGSRLLRFDATVLRQPGGDLTLPIYAGAAVLAGGRMPRPREDISGALWLQGFRYGALPR